jgi:mono/diheme cytochrome c family protein
MEEALARQLTVTERLRAVTMFGRSVRLTISSLMLCAASAAGAQGNLEEGKTAAQIYASDCATCHKSPQSVSDTKWLFGLESFLRQHYTSSGESAAILAAYLKGQQKPSAESRRGQLAKHASQAKASDPTPSESEEDIPRPPADIPNAKR